jgi:hypothetical protein
MKHYKKNSNRWEWVKHSVTDYDNETYDVGRVTVFYMVFGLVTLVILSMLGLSIIDVFVNHQPFKASDLGVAVGTILGGIGGMLMGIGIYLFGDRKNRPGDDNGTEEDDEKTIITTQNTTTVNTVAGATGANTSGTNQTQSSAVTMVTG